VARIAPKIVHRYIFREILVPFLFGLSVFTFILLIARLLKLIELVVNRGVPTLNILRLFAYIMPAFLEVTVPMAMLLAILIALGRLSADGELVALRSSGLSLYQLVPPIALFVALATIATAVLSIQVRPWGNRSLRVALYDIARSRASAGLRPQVFNDEFPGLVIYAEAIDATNDSLRRVLISDERSAQRNTIFAREGTMVSDARTQTLTLRLANGFIHSTEGPEGADYQTDFQSYDVNLDLRETLAVDRPRDDPKEMTLAELRDTIERKRTAGTTFGSELVEYHRKFSIPFACVVFGLVAVPLGLQPVRGARAHGFAISLGMIFVYYILLSAGQAVAERRLVPAVVGLWLPNVVFAAAGCALFTQAARERTGDSLGRLSARLADWRARLSPSRRVASS
jgi:lipopolysaccharide export system permease protein